MQLRIVFNEQTECYRVESRGLLGWNFVTDDETGDYLSFDDQTAAMAWVKEHVIPPDNDSNRRWKVVTFCN